MSCLAQLTATVSIVTLYAFGAVPMAADGIVTVRSAFGPAETMSRLQTEVKAGGFMVFARVDHAAGAAAVNLPLRPTDLLIFGAAKGGTPLMQAAQTVGIDLPLKALVWQDEAGTTFLSYNDPVYLAERHGLDASAHPGVTTMSGALKAIAGKATASP